MFKMTNQKQILPPLYLVTNHKSLKFYAIHLQRYFVLSLRRNDISGFLTRNSANKKGK